METSDLTPEPDLVAVPTNAATASGSEDNLRQYLEQEIDKHLHMFLNLRTRLNTLAPVSRLPSELIAEIFLHHAVQCELDHEQQSGGKSYVAYYAWVRVTHVCRHWREVATSCPRLWNRVLITRAPWAASMLDRSKALPLTIKALIPDSLPTRGGRFSFSAGRVRADRKIEAMALVLRELPRIKHFSILARKDLLEKVWTTVCDPARYLQTLNITYVDESRRWTEEDKLVPAALLSDQLSNLQQVELRLCVFHWIPETFPASLRRLIITRPRGPLPDMTGMLDILENLPLLEVLTLERAIPTLPEDSESVERQLRPVDKHIALPRLRSIRLTSLLMTDCAHLLRYLTFPPQAVIALLGGFESVEGALVLGSVLATKIAGADPLRTLSVQYDGSLSTESLSLIGSRASKPLDEFDPDGQGIRSSIPNELEIAFSALANAHYVTITETLCQQLPLTQVHALQVATRRLSFPSLPRVWLDAFGQMKGLTRLRASAASADGLMSALCMRTGADSPVDGSEERAERPQEYFMARLQALELESVWFGSSDRTKREFVEELRDCLVYRSKNGVPIRQLVLADCINADNEDIDPLKELVGELKWDGSVQWIPEDDEHPAFEFPEEELV